MARIHPEHTLLRARDWQDRPQFDTLCEWWRDVGAGVCGLVGIGGAGKTAIAERFLRVVPGVLAKEPNLAKDPALPTPAGLFVFSFYDAPNPDTFFDALYKWLVAAFDVPDRRREAADGTRVQASASLVTDALAGIRERFDHPETDRLLLVLDGLEKVQDDGARGGVFGQIKSGGLRETLLRATAGYLPGVAVLITTRFILHDLEYERVTGRAPLYGRIPVDRISEEACVGLLRKRGVTRGSQEDLRRVARECGHLALTVDLVAGYLLHFCDGNPNCPLDMPSTQDLEEVAAETGDLQRGYVAEQSHRFARVAERYDEAMAEKDPAALALLQRVCLFRLGVSADILAQVFLGKGKKKEGISGKPLARLSRKEMQAKLRWLVEMRLLEATRPKAAAPQSEIRNATLRSTSPKSEMVYTVHPAVRDGFLAGLDKETARLGHDAVQEGLTACLGGLPGFMSCPSDPATLDLLEEIVYHTLEAGHAQEAWDIYWHRIGGGRNLLWRLGAYERGERICRAFAAGRPPEEAPLPSGLSENDQGRFINEWALYLIALGRLAATAPCHERSIDLRLRQQSWKNASIAKQNLSEVLALAGRLKKGLRAATGALRLAERAKDAWEQGTSYGYLAHAEALCGRTQKALSDFETALNGQHEVEGKTDRPLYSIGGVWQAFLLARLGRCRECGRLSHSNIRILKEIQGTSYTIPRCQLILADVARVSADRAGSRSLWQRAYDWALERGDKQVLCWSGLVKARMERDEGNPDACRNALHEGLRIARECGYAIHHIDLLVERARLHLSEGDGRTAEADARVALETGLHPPADSGLPELLAATDAECGYAWGEGDARHVLAEALLLQAAQKMGTPRFAPRKIKTLPDKVQALIQEARKHLERSARLRKRIQDPRVQATDALRKQLRGGVLTTYPLSETEAVALREGGEAVIKTVVELDLVGYSTIAAQLEEGLDVELSPKLNAQIQGFIDVGLKAAKAPRDETVMQTTGDGAILFFDKPADAHRFAAAVCGATREHNKAKTQAIGKRLFRIGAATGQVVMKAKPGGGYEIAGMTIARAVRLEARADPGGILLDQATYGGLTVAQKNACAAKETVQGKRDEQFQAHRCVLDLDAATDAAFFAKKPADAKPAAPAEPKTEDLRSEVFRQLGRLPSHRYSELVFLVEMPVELRPPNTLPLQEKKDRILHWADEEPDGLKRLLSALRKLLEPEAS